MPVIRLGGSKSTDVLHISFDDMQHNYRRFSYKVQHCEADWSPSESLFESDYIDGFYDGLTIDDATESINTQMLYTHYSFSFPNDRCQLKMSGNYELTVFDDNNDEEVLKVCFMVVEEKTTIAMTMTPNTDIDNRRKHQQIELSVRYNGISPVRPHEQVKTVVLQNQMWSMAHWNPKCTAATVQGMEWTHCRDLIFDAGNEFRKYEILAVNHATMGIDRIDWDGENYHVYPWPVLVSASYLYDEDSDGAFLIRNSDNEDVDFTTEYVYVHYRFPSERLAGDIFIDGRFTNGRYDADYNMLHYNDITKCYEAVILQKQGYYNYTLTQVLPDGTVRLLPEAGNFYETNNSYQVLVYYRGQTDRTDRLVGVYF